MQGTWSQYDLKLHVNVWELRAIWLACVVFLHCRALQPMQILMDNMSTVNYVNKQGCALLSPVCQEAIKLWTWWYPQGITPLTLHILEAQLLLASYTGMQALEWTPQMSIIKPIFHQLRALKIDPFARQDSTKCPNFCSRECMSLGCSPDAFLLQWTPGLLYSFSPNYPGPQAIIWWDKTMLIINSSLLVEAILASDLIHTSILPPLCLCLPGCEIPAPLSDIPRTAGLSAPDCLVVDWLSVTDFSTGSRNPPTEQEAIY